MLRTACWDVGSRISIYILWMCWVDVLSQVCSVDEGEGRLCGWEIQLMAAWKNKWKKKVWKAVTVKELHTNHAHVCKGHYSLPVCMHIESHRPEQFCTVVQKLPFCLQALKLHLVVVPCLEGGEEEKQQYSEIKGGGVYLIRYIYTSSPTNCTLYRGRILKIEPFDFPLFSSI